ncbi:hypothetical protein [Aquimarina sp. SS2-1]|uniref:hypothetical protein n=1 Tax=Aquimarina besae TaxID=3342247 RepID=UPI00367199B0
MHQKLQLLLLCIICYSCNTTSDTNERYFIPQNFKNEGVINKYYTHIYPKNKQNIKTSLDYSWTKKLNDSLYTKDIYNPAFKLQSSKQFTIEGTDAVEVDYKRYYPRDTLNAVYPDDIKTTYIPFSKDTVYYHSRLHNRDSIYIDVQHITKLVKDTLIESKPAKIIEQTTTSTTVFGTTRRDTMQYHSRNIYVRDLGLYSSTLTTDENVIKRILVEQILPKQFDSLSKHGIQRVGYIDFDKTIDKDKDLTLCTDHKFIADYYNGGNDRAGFIGGKGNLKKIIFEKLDANKLNNASGYLTFRFVINCKGIAGKFITDESADFDYNEKQFSKETVTHLYEIISGVEKWKPCVIRNVKRDSYFYVTFILKNGEIQDILP